MNENLHRNIYLGVSAEVDTLLELVRQGDWTEAKKSAALIRMYMFIADVPPREPTYTVYNIHGEDVLDTEYGHGLVGMLCDADFVRTESLACNQDFRCEYTIDVVR